MFTAFDAPFDREKPRRLGLAALASVTLLATLGFVASLISGHPVDEKKPEWVVDVAFRPLPPPPKPVRIERAPPPPAPKVARVTPPVAAPALEAPAPAAAPMVAPKAIPIRAAPEVDPSQAVAARELAVGGTGDGSGSATGHTEDDSPAPVTATALGGPINLPEEAEPPEPDDGNAVPEYPESERTVGHEAVVILKIVIEASGTVGRIVVMKGDEPFLAAAMRAVKSWRYEPARLEGQSIATFKIVKIPFRLRA